MRLAVIATILLPLLSACIEPVLADGPSLDVLGIKLDSGLDDAEAALKSAVGDATLLPNTGTLSLSGYTSPTLQFSVDAVEGDLMPWKDMKPNRATGGYNSEYLTLLLSLDPSQKVIGIRRDKAFTIDKSPTVADFRNGLIQKYGKPVYEDVNKMQWIYNASAGAASSGSGSMKYVDCSLAATQTSYAFAQATIQLSEPDRIAKCGTFVQVSMEAQADNPQLLEQFEIWMTDLRAMTASYNYIYKSLNDGVNGQQQTQTQNAAKPTL